MATNSDKRCFERKAALARTLCMLEAVTGQIYLTVLVARPVGLQIVHRTNESQDCASKPGDD